MDEVIKNGQSAENEAPETKDAGSQEQKASGDAIKGPGFGVDEKGCFFVQAHMSLPYAVILGVLQEACEFLQENHPNSVKNRMKRTEDKKIIQPQKGFRGFNIFKR